ncbi:pyruvate formate lyase activating enzyme [Desulfotomaculum arcticum]|uniref:Pyruvate formate lyase activating enzyme n=1 Tax=Desulfotruncus arcticus DSM 17038 TaxID=1121424 RepID=A0A1I2WR81_9FIRM|nr:AmmeMemoRadiSam system radical SAM enzyme [Desulfotruncus arcticus]SFH03197.1 pyruvate formate lyase activating enzyme [Desulfotomaculum arcticum] [Desulfotruncus arcticus DSM 17038]
MKREVIFYTKGEQGVANCKVCPRLCNIKPGQRGFCRVRENRDGVLYATNYGECSSYALDPIEKKPLYHFYPGQYILSLGTVGCNLRCGFCQNWQIAQEESPTTYISPRQAVDLALQQKARGYSCVGLAYTYSEPFMWYEYVYDTAKLAREAGLKNVLVTNGYVSEEPLKEILPYIDAMNIDVKAFTEDFYRSTCAGRLEPVKRTVEIAYRHCHVEITTLLVTGLNDGPEEITRLAEWLSGLNAEIPLHFSRYFPNYKMDLPPTPEKTLLQAREIARRQLRYVYIGNAPQLKASGTHCPECGQLLLDRAGYQVKVLGPAGGTCPGCGEKIAIVM